MLVRAELGLRSWACGVGRGKLASILDTSSVFRFATTRPAQLSPLPAGAERVFIAYLRLPPNRVVELGLQVEI